MNIGWLKIIGATLFELVWVTGLKYAELPWQWGVTALSILGSSICGIECYRYYFSRIFRFWYFS